MKDTRFTRKRERFPQLDDKTSVYAGVFFLSLSVFLGVAAATIVIFALKELFS